MDRYAAAHPDLAAELRRRLAGEPSPGLAAALPSWQPGDDLATRNASQAVINAIAPVVPELFGGAADLSESNLTDVRGATDLTAEEAGRNVRFGVREHAMGGIANGLAYHGGFVPYVGTFLTFSDYMRGSVRLAALSGLHVVYVWTHDSVGLGEDGPTHQPVEQIAALRAMPGLWVVRPGDANETATAWAMAVARRDGPVALVLTRQKLPTLAGTAALAAEGVRRGGYVLRPASGEADGRDPQLVLIATGSELALAVEAAEALETDGFATRVVSLPCLERFEAQDAAYRHAVLPPTVAARVSVEAGVSFGWERWVGDHGAIVGLDRFGASAPGPTVMRELGFAVDHVADVARGVVAGRIRGRVSPPAEH